MKLIDSLFYNTKYFCIRRDNTVNERAVDQFGGSTSRIIYVTDMERFFNQNIKPESAILNDNLFRKVVSETFTQENPPQDTIQESLPANEKEAPITRTIEVKQITPLGKAVVNTLLGTLILLFGKRLLGEN